jgi:hypothetical protein
MTEKRLYGISKVLEICQVINQQIVLLFTESELEEFTNNIKEELKDEGIIISSECDDTIELYDTVEIKFGCTILDLDKNNVTDHHMKYIYIDDYKFDTSLIKSNKDFELSKFVLLKLKGSDDKFITHINNIKKSKYEKD